MKLNQLFQRVALAAFLVWMGALAHAQQGNWIKISDALFQSVPEYDGSVPGARGIGGVAVDRVSGHLIVGLNGPPFGLWRSADAGKSWERIDGGKVEGGWVRSFSLIVDQEKPGHIAAFRAYPPGPTNETGRLTSLSAITLDGGNTWQLIPPPAGFQGFGGWVHGMVDWNAADAPRVIAQDRIRAGFHVSVDGGKTMKKLAMPRFMGIIEPTWTHEHMRKNDPKLWSRFESQTARGYGIRGEALLIGRHDGIERSEDAGKTFVKVSDFVVAAHTPVFFDGALYWGAEKGLIVSKDDGKTWALLGAGPPMVCKGPFLGADSQNMVVVTADGVYRTRNAGGAWEKICGLFRDPDAWRNDVEPLWLRHDYAWDHSRGVIYAAGMAGSLHRMEVAK